MPLDGHSYLVSQGWGGKGTALREGAISRPITIAQKKNLGGLGKDRDEAFPFWDHVFSAAAKSIQIKYTSDDEDDSGSSTTAPVTLKRTSTGILSTRRPVEGTPAASGSTTPDAGDQPPVNSRLSLVAHAKREAAKRGLYSRFFRGPILGPEAIEAEEKRLAALVSAPFDKENPNVEKLTITEHIEVETEDHHRVVVDLEVSKSFKHKKRSHKDEKECKQGEDNDDEKQRARKKRRKEDKRKKAKAHDIAGTASTSTKKDKKDKSESKTKARSKHDAGTTAIPPELPTESLENGEGRVNISRSKDKKHESEPKTNAAIATIDTRAESGPSTPAADEKVRESKAERAQRKEEKRRAKALRKGEPLAGSGDVEPSMLKADDRRPSKSSNHDKSSRSSWKGEPNDAVTVAVEEPTRKKKRKRTDE